MNDQKDDELTVTDGEERPFSEVENAAEQVKNTLHGRPLEEFIERSAVTPVRDLDALREKIAKAEEDLSNQAVIDLARGGDNASRDIWQQADKFEQERARQLAMSCDDYRETINRVAKEAAARKIVLGSERPDGTSAIEFRKQAHIQRLKTLVAMHLGISEDQITDEDIERIHSQLTPNPAHIPLTPNDGVTEVELGFRYLIEQMDQQLEDDVRPEPTVVEQVVETASEVKTELGGVLGALQSKAVSALDELANTAKRNLGSLLRKSAEYALHRVEQKERHLSEKEMNMLRDLVDNTQAQNINVEDVTKIADGIEELGPVLQSLGDAEHRLNKILKNSQAVKDAEKDLEARSVAHLSAMLEEGQNPFKVDEEDEEE